MPKTFVSEVVETSNTTGTGTYSLAGAKLAYRRFRDALTSPNLTTYYGVRNKDNTKWELNRNATFTTGTPDTLTRNVFLSSNANTPVSWVAGDLPLTVYVPSAADVFEAVITGWLDTARHALMRFGLWFHKDEIASGQHGINIYDGSSDIRIGEVDAASHSVYLYAMPAGAGIDFWGTAIPAGFLVNAGQAVSRTTHFRLYAAIGTTHGAGDGSTTFNMPDCRDRFTVGKGDMGGSAAGRITNGVSGINTSVLGATGGQESRTVSISVTGSTAGSLGFTTGTAANGTAVFASGGGGVATGFDHYHTGSTSGSLTVSASGTSSAVATLPPTIVCYKLTATGGT